MSSVALTNEHCSYKTRLALAVLSHSSGRGGGRKESARERIFCAYVHCMHPPGERVVVWKGKEAKRELLGASGSGEKGTPVEAGFD